MQVHYICWTSICCQRKQWMPKRRQKLLQLTQLERKYTTVITRWGQNHHGPFLRAVLLMAVKASTQAMVAEPERYTVQCNCLYSLSFFEGLPPPLVPPLPRSAMTKLKQPICLCCTYRAFSSCDPKSCSCHVGVHQLREQYGICSEGCLLMLRTSQLRPRLAMERRIGVIDLFGGCPGEEVPPVEASNLVAYLVLQINFLTTTQFKAHKSLEAYNQFACGWVKDMHLWKVAGKL